MKIKFNTSGTHIHKGFLKVRVDLYPDMEDKTYQLHHIQVPIIPPEGYTGALDEQGNPLNEQDYNNWIESLPKVWQLNPCLCHFITMDEDVDLAKLIDVVKKTFDKITIRQLDDNLASGKSISGVMRTKGGSGKKVKQVDIGKINAQLSSLEIEV